MHRHPFAAAGNISIFPNPAADLIAVQLPGLTTSDYSVTLHDASGRQLMRKEILAGQTIAYFDTQTLYRGVYYVRVTGQDDEVTRKVVVE